MAYRAITISGEACTGKTTVAVELLKLLPGWEGIYTGKLLRKACADRGWSVQRVAELPDEVHRDIDRYQGEILRTATGKVVEGRLAGWLARDLPDVFRVFCWTEPEERIRRYRQREGCSPDRSKTDLVERDMRDVIKYRTVYGVEDYRCPDYYQLRLDTSDRTPNQLAQVVARAAGLMMLHL